ncbi:MAG: hypothetical protein LBR52_05430 [Prevotellaceae bacterium]|jgi:hypothetical protein|nr:hypothetical protein [Prevotellaceae bacterium]
MKKRIIKTMIISFFVFACPANAQVTIGSDVEPNPDALLDLKEGVAENADESNRGLLLPRVKLTSTDVPDPLQNDVEGMFVYNTNTENDVTPGIYYNDGNKWVRTGDAEWFYLPSFNLDLDTSSGSTKTVDLYDEVYARQFTNDTNNPNFVAPAGLTFSTATNKKLYEKEQLAFVVTNYDNTVITVSSISVDGVMSYTVLDTDPPVNAYINIICVVK